LHFMRFPVTRQISRLLYSSLSERIIRLALYHPGAISFGFAMP
jgi:hypothetical protein